MPRPQQQVSYAQYFTVYLMDLLFNQVEIFYNNIPLRQISSQKIVDVNIQPLIAII
jgi:hypothetical protein